MSHKFKDIDIENCKYYFFDDIINKNFFDPNKIKTNEKWYKNILIYYIGYLTIKDSKYLKINSVNPLYLIFNKVNGYFEEINKDKYLMLVPTNESKEIKNMKNYEVKSEIELVQHLKTHIIMMKNMWKSNLVQMTSYL